MVYEVLCHFTKIPRKIRYTGKNIDKNRFCPLKISSTAHIYIYSRTSRTIRNTLAPDALKSMTKNGNILSDIDILQKRFLLSLSEGIFPPLSFDFGMFRASIIRNCTVCTTAHSSTGCSICGTID